MSQTVTSHPDASALIERLAGKLDVPREIVATVVAEEQDAHASARIQAYVPVLVEHSATERLRRLKRQPV